ncbi:MAG TPA: HAMP domain-containing sensor histidine kinase [Myxococcota bacterium]|nr:HAMP domain-containing sensor histidine kinase [Myxococcota bacterium]
MSLTGIIVALSVGVLLPVLLSTAVGIVTLALGENSDPIVVGVLVVSFAAAALGSIVTVTVLLGKRARIARLQADLLANVTHDLRTPLAAIRMYAQTLQSGQLQDDRQRVQESLETIVRQTQWLDSMIDRLLTWRAAAKDRVNLQMTTQPLKETVEETVRRFSSMLAPGEVNLSLEIMSCAPVAHDGQAIGSVVLNLLINAYKYTRDDKKISVSVEDRDGRVALSVTDNGIGIPKQELRRIFEPFHRIDSKLGGKSSGAGLGLAIVRHLVKAHGGEVRVESIENQGSRFTILLPAIFGEERSE